MNLIVVAEEACTDLVPVILDRDIVNTFEHSRAHLPVRGDAMPVGEAIRDLIDTALRHGGPNPSALCPRHGRLFLHAVHEAWKLKSAVPDCSAMNFNV